MEITNPGIYLDMPSNEYLADPCPRPSFSQSLAQMMIVDELSPLHAWHAHPRLNPDFKSDEDTKFDLGNVAHKLVLGRGKDFVVVEAEDWRTKAAQIARKDAAAEGKIGVLGKQIARAQRMADAARERIAMHKVTFFLEGHGDAEVCVAWEERGIWFRQLIDWLTKDRLTVVDYKTTDIKLGNKTMANMLLRWSIQAAMAERGLGAVDPLGSRRRYYFVVQETSPPYALRIAEISKAALTMGRKQLDHAAEVWADCMRANIFPGYPVEIVTPEYPGWAEQQWLDREIHEAARGRQAQPADLIMGG